MKESTKRTAFIWKRSFWNIINVFTVTYDQFDAVFLNKISSFFVEKCLTF